MADTIERLYKLTVDGTQAARQLGEIARATDSLDKKFAAVGKAAAAFGGALAAAFSAGAIVHGIKGIIDSFDQIGKDAQKVGVAAEELQRLRYAADLSGVSAESLDTALKRLSVGLFEVGEGTTDAAKALRALGAKGGDSAEQTLMRIADQFAAMPDGIAKVKLAIDIFGKAVGPDLIPMLNGGSKALKDLTDQASKFGFVVKQESIDAAEAFNDDLSRLERVAAGVGAQLTAGMLPALRTLSQALVDAATEGDGFVETGAAIGEMLLNLIGFTLKAGATLHAFGITTAAVWAALRAPPGEVIGIFRTMVAEVNALEAKTNKTLAGMQANFEKFKAAAAAAPPAIKDSTNEMQKLLRQQEEAAKAAKAAEEAAKRREAAAKAALKQEQEATKALEEQERRRMSTAKVLIEIEERDAQVKADLAAQSERYAKEAADAAEATHQLIRALDPTTAAAEDFATKLAQINELFVQGEIDATQLKRMLDELQKGWAKTGDSTKKQKDAIDIVSEGFENFFENLARGTADAEDLFKRMVESIILQIFKLYALKPIVDAIVGALGLKAGATGFAFDQQGAIPFARGGVISRPVMFPMALAGEAGPEAILPLKRTASGDLGVQSEAAQMNVTIHNHTPATVTTRRTGPTDLEVIIEQTRAAIANDLRTGGNPVSRSLESAYGIGRGSAAAY